ncbi:MAG TPA: hypothetical protein ENG51_04495 [Deltaproteobacteria bacterium]|nr:hypothetical protein [bacterium]OQX59785.1 MAG: hypothetical protein B5M50_02165 [candidate division KSB1 bacterium 4484_219]RKY79218.1 MAG: hypothetical protein DRQ12_04290 [candidate division KSB1 bacterium]HDM75713.1 hypothetical protein [Deltaproteobacteria bacterium]RKY86503.1 MAG: hypothetical protein DRP98_00195 [candidate division KSB1 bacterium]
MSNWFRNLPLFWALLIAVAGFLGMLIWAWFRPKAYIYQDAPDQRWWRDLRIWASLLMLIQIALYVVFGT